MKTSAGKTRLKDIARETGFAISTVAKVMSGAARQSRISDKAAAKIQTAARSLGYTPNIMARNLRSRKSGLIGIHVASATDSIIAATLTAILQELPSMGFSPLVTIEETGYRACHDTWIRNGVEGLLFCGPTQAIPDSVIDELETAGIPIVLAGNPLRTHRAITGRKLATVQIDNHLGIGLAIDHLIAIGRRKIGFISGPRSHSDAEERRKAYEDIIGSRHAPVVADIGDDELFWRRGYQSASKLISSHSGIDSIIAYDDNVALGAMKFLSDSGLSIPDDIAVVGFDNQPQAEYSIPSLTTIDQPADKIGRQSLTLLEHLIAHRKPPELHIQIHPSLVVRASTTGGGH
jgi:DNA-binding LacI/PurR family transcriptional regulator